MNASNSHRWIHRLAWLTALVALLPIGLGAVVTTVDAGMAFADWPTSDGQGMLAYPWLRSTGDQFLEHGHRLAGMLVGVISLVLAAVAFSSECRSDVKFVVGLIVAGVVVQGLLGGLRVVADARVLALVHGNFAAWVFSLMGVLIAMTGDRWDQRTPFATAREGWITLSLGLLAFITLFNQYLLGGMLRHLGAAHAWLAHPWFAIAVLATTLMFWIAVERSTSQGAARAARWAMGLLVVQALLGVMTWGVRYGFPQWGIVAVQQTSFQVSIRSFHKVLGLLSFMSLFVAMVRVGVLLPSVSSRTNDNQDQLPSGILIPTVRAGSSL